MSKYFNSNCGKYHARLTDLLYFWGRRGRGRMVVGFTTTCAIIVHHH